MKIRWGGVITAMVTAFDHQGALDIKANQDLASYLTGSGSEALVVAGTTGESPTLTFEEKLRLLEAVKAAVDGQAPVIVGTGSNSTAASVELTKRAAEAGADAVMLVVPYYNKPSQEGLYQHFLGVASSTTLPVMLYNVPSRTSRNLEAETVARLSRVENIVALKEASGDMDQVSQILRLVPEDFPVYSGDDSLTLPMLALGCRGVVSVASHVAGGLISRMVQSYRAGEVEAAAQLHRQLFPLFKALFVTSNPVPVKAALNLLGIRVGGLRRPLVEATESEIKVVRDALGDLGLIPS